ncbi:MAG TPA: hypothetical protein VIT90_01245 [Lysobacter sp.]
MKTLISLAVALLSTGWLVPMWFGVDLYLQFWHSEGWPLLLNKPQLNSLDFLQSSSSCLKVGFVWLALVVFFWSFVAARNSRSGKVA